MHLVFSVMNFSCSWGSTGFEKGRISESDVTKACVYFYDQFCPGEKKPKDINGLFMSLLALIVTRDQIFNVFCLQLHRKNVSKKATLGFLCFMKSRGSVGSFSVWLSKSGAKRTALTLCPTTWLLCGAADAQRFKFSYHRLRWGWLLPAWVRGRVSWSCCKLSKLFGAWVSLFFFFFLH